MLAALRARQVYATNGPRIWLSVALDGAPMGSRVAAKSGNGAHELEIEVVGSGPIERVDLIRGGAGESAVESREVAMELEWSERGAIPGLAPGEYFYVRVVQADGGAAWSSPIRAR